MFSRPVFNAWGRVVFVGLALAACGGCGGPNLGTFIKAGGTVKYNGNPVSGALVTFQPPSREKGERPAFGTTDAQGRFSLQTSEGGANTVQGAKAGDYKVTVTKLKLGGAMPAAGSEADGRDMLKKMTDDQLHPTATVKSQEDADKVQAQQQQGFANKNENELPKKYETVDDSGLAFTVKAGDKNEFAIELTD